MSAATERLYWDEERTVLVPEGDERGRYLACAPGDPIPEIDAADEPVEAEKPEPDETEKVEAEPAPKATPAKRPARKRS